MQGQAISATMDGEAERSCCKKGRNPTADDKECRRDTGGEGDSGKPRDTMYNLKKRKTKGFEKMKYHDLFAKAVSVHNACEVIRRDNNHLSRHDRKQVREFFYAGNLDTVQFLEPFSVELWLKAMICWDLTPEKPSESKDERRDRTHILSTLWNRISKEGRKVIEDEYDYYKKCVNLRASYGTMKSAFPKFDWEIRDMDGIVIPKILSVLTHYNNAFTNNRYASPMKVPSFARSKEAALKERGFQSGLTCTRAAMRSTLYKEAKTEDKDYVIDPFSYG